LCTYNFLCGLGASRRGLTETPFPTNLARPRCVNGNPVFNLAGVPRFTLAEGKASAGRPASEALPHEPGRTVRPTAFRIERRQVRRFSRHQPLAPRRRICPQAKAGCAGRRGVIMLLLNLMLVTVFLVLLAVSVGEVCDAVHATQRARRRDAK
jgi:hypothetical protein